MSELKTLPAAVSVCVGDIVTICNYELGRPEQRGWIGTLLEVKREAHTKNNPPFPFMSQMRLTILVAYVLWNTGEIYSIDLSRINKVS